MRQPYRIFRTWIWEILSVALAIGLVSAILGLLLRYNGKEIPDWGVNLNFNALLALLSTILRAMLVVVVSQIICQQKWEWYGGERARPLADLQRYDSGSRGSFGALWLIPTVLLKDMTALIAAIVLVVSFLVGPFVQQASRTVACTFPDSNLNASIPFAHWVPRRGGFAPNPNALTAIPAADTVLAILSSVTSPDGVENQISASCSTGNCTFSNGDPEGVDFSENERTTHSTVGMCNTCVDATPLIIHEVKPFGYENYTTIDTYTLPINFTVFPSGRGNIKFALMAPAPNLTWLGDMLTPELRAMSRWAYVNATFLASKRNRTIAAVCVLYPCLRTYTASITNNQLSEKHVRSEVMQVEMPDVDAKAVENIQRTINAEYNYSYNYTAIKSPCRVGGEVYDAQNMSQYSGATKLSVFDLTEQAGSTPSPYTYRNITAPEQCIYRQHPQFVGAIAKELSQEIFNGICEEYKSINCNKRPKDGKEYTGEGGMLSDLGASTVMQALVDGDMVYSNVTRWFDSFANSMTNRFRFEYGAASLDTKSGNKTLGQLYKLNQPLPLGQIHGLAWQSTTCVAMHWHWLLLPICLTLITAILMMKTIFANWRHRRTRPVWKDSIMPLIFYGHKIESQEPKALVAQPSEDALNRDHADTKDEDHLLETSEMNKISGQTLVTFRWPDHVNSEEYSSVDRSAVPVQQEKSWLRRRNPQHTSNGGLLEAKGGYSSVNITGGR